jgi:sugar lactone lactonase YvrE
MTFNTLPKFAGAFFNWLSRIGCGLLVMQAFAAPLPAVDLLYVSLNNNTIVSYDTTGNVGTTIAASVSIFVNTNPDYTRGLAFDTSGNLYAANAEPNTISKFNSSAGYVSNIAANLSYPNALIFDSSGNLYAANYGNSTISKFNSTGGYVSNIATNLSGPFGLAFDSLGYLYASNASSNTISKFNSTGGYVSNIATNLSYPIGLALDSSDNLYAANYGNNTISKFNSSGGYVSIITTNLSIPFGLVLDSSGNLYAANSGNSTISKFDSSGTFLTSWSVGTAAPSFLAFKPVSVPEPSTYALATIGTSVIAYLARRRKAKQAVVIMVAVEEFLSIPEEIRDKLYQKRVEQYEKRLAHPAPKSFGLPNTPSKE